MYVFGGAYLHQEDSVSAVGGQSQLKKQQNSIWRPDGARQFSYLSKQGRCVLAPQTTQNYSLIRCEAMEENLPCIKFLMSVYFWAVCGVTDTQYIVPVYVHGHVQMLFETVWQ